MDSIIAGERFAEILQVEVCEPLLVIEGVDWDHNQRPSDCYRTWIPPNPIKIEVKVMPGASGAGGQRRGATAPSFPGDEVRRDGGPGCPETSMSIRVRSVRSQAW